MDVLKFIECFVRCTVKNVIPVVYSGCDTSMSKDFRSREGWGGMESGNICAVEECGPGYLFDMWFKGEVGVKEDAEITYEF